MFECFVLRKETDVADQYKIKTLKMPTQRELNKYLADGWEIVDSQQNILAGPRSINLGLFKVTPYKVVTLRKPK